MTTDTTTSGLLQTALHQFHVDLGAKMVDFAGWSMPLHYGSILEEHHQVRNSGGIFDVSHMGRIRFTGRDACRFLDHICTRQIHGMADGQARYGIVTNADGGCRDDVLIYRISDGEYLMVCNASNRTKMLDHIEATRGEFVFKHADETESTVMIAVQGPKVMEFIGNFSSSIPELKRYRFLVQDLGFAKVMISRTGYTGEDGVEVIMPASFAPMALQMLAKEGIAEEGSPLRPAGLGARDSLRLEAGMALYGHEITEEIDPISAGLNFAVKVNKAEDDPSIGRFIGQDVIEKVAADGPARTLTGLQLEGRRAARQGMSVLHDGTVVGVVTSGCSSPSLGTSIAMAMVDTPLTEKGTALQVDLGRAAAEAEVVGLPFLKR